MTPSEQLYMDGYLRKVYAKAKKIIKQDWDCVFLVDGTEGGGKSVLAQQGAYEVDPSFHISRIAFTPEEFKTAILNANKYQAVIYDEAYTGLSSRGTMSDINKTLVSMLAEIRQKNLFVFIVMPTFFDLDKYAAIWRSRGLLHVYTDKGYGRGYFSYYNKDRKKNLYILGKKFYDYKKPRPNFRGRFTSYYTVDETEYRARKLKALGNHKTNAEQKVEDRFIMALKVLCANNPSTKVAEELKARGLDLSARRIQQLIKNSKENKLNEIRNTNNTTLNKKGGVIRLREGINTIYSEVEDG
jgi:hypothetical protein